MTREPSSKRDDGDLIRDVSGEGLGREVDDGFGVDGTSSYVPQNGHDTRSARTAQILRQPERIALQLHVAGFAADLGNEIAELRHAGGAHGMALGFQAARGVDRLLAGARGGAGSFDTVRPRRVRRSRDPRAPQFRRW